MKAVYVLAMSIALSGSLVAQSSQGFGKREPHFAKGASGLSKIVQPSVEQAPEFIANRGQWDKRVRFLGRAPGVDMWITDSGITYDYYGGLAKAASKRTGQVVRVAFDGVNSRTASTAFGKRSHTYSFLIGNDRSKWVRNVPAYSSATVKELYKGVDLVAYFDPKRNMPRYDLVVKPGADASKIAMRYLGADKLRLNKHGLVSYQIRLGEVQERDLLAYQEAGSPRCGKGFE